ncbi:MAG TPA: HNH endonuclease [Mycobacteriales bacterium]|nr:HNH endonuclease [Mycobacteriales bacterium]
MTLSFPQARGGVSAPSTGATTALVLNASYEPLCVVPTRRAAVLVLTHKAEAVTDGDGVLHSERRALPVPAVVRLTRFVKVPFRGQVTLTRRAVFSRDHGACGYCGDPANTIDHVVPRSRGGRHTWDNVVAACHRCNHLKADRTLVELGWELRTPPLTPSGLTWRILGHRRPDPRWYDWLGGTVTAAAA